MTEKTYEMWKEKLDEFKEKTEAGSPRSQTGLD